MINLLNIGERTGSGIPMIFEAWKGEGFNEPAYTEQIEINRCFLSLSLTKTSDKKQAITIKTAKPKNKKSDDRKRSILDYLAFHAASTSKEVAEHLGISSDRARVYLQEFASNGIVIAEGQNRNRTYRLKVKR